MEVKMKNIHGASKFVKYK